MNKISILLTLFLGFIAFYPKNSFDKGYQKSEHCKIIDRITYKSPKDSIAFVKEEP